MSDFHTQTDRGGAVDPLSGVWTGYYSHRGVHWPMRLRLEFRERKVSGLGADEVGEFTVAGTYRCGDGKVAWTKRYSGAHDVHYAGIIGPADEIHGLWALAGEFGEFSLWTRDPTAK